MRAVVARVLEASVEVHESGTSTEVGRIDGQGLLVLLGITAGDTETGAETMARKLHELRVLRDEQSCASSGAPLLIVSQFTLYGNTAKGRRPSWAAAARPEIAEPLVEAIVRSLRSRGATVRTGKFGAQMSVRSVNDGPFTVLVEV